MSTVSSHDSQAAMIDSNQFGNLTHQTVIHIKKKGGEVFLPLFQK